MHPTFPRPASSDSAPGDGAATVPQALLDAKEREHHIEIVKLRMRLLRYRMLLEEHGIEPPDHDDDELLAMWRDCRVVISSASSVLMRMGSAKELLEVWPSP